MKKSLLLVLCLILLTGTVYSQDHQQKDVSEVKNIVEEISKKIFKDPKIQLMDIDDVASEVQKENDKNVNNIKNTVKEDSTVKSLGELHNKVLNNDFETPLQKAGQHPGEKISGSDFLESSGVQSKNTSGLSPGNLNTIAPKDLVPGALEAPSLQELPPIPGSKIKTKYLNHVDSLRKINLSDEKIKLSEKVEGKSKEVVLKEKQSIKERVYFEGVVGVLSDNFKVVNLSPALGYQMLNKYSMGLGPNIALNRGDASSLSPFGVRSFAKYEIIKRKIYLQLENVAVPVKEIRDGTTDGESIRKNIINHSLSLGGGYLLHLSNSSSLNFALLYRMNKNEIPFEDISPLSFRLGVSSFGGSRKSKF